MYAVIETGGKQYRVREGDTLRVEKLAAEEGAKIQFDKVLMVGEGEGANVGMPYVSGVKVSATVTAHGRGDKIKVVKFKRRKNYLRRHGHRQDYTEVTINKIAGGAKAKAAAKDEAKPVADPKPKAEEKTEPKAKAKAKAKAEPKAKAKTKTKAKSKAKSKA